MRCRGLTEREISAALVEHGIHVSFVTVHKDLQVITAGWKQSAQASIGEHKAKQAAKLEEVERQAWAQKKLDIVLRAIKQQAELLGLDAPVKTENDVYVYHANRPIPDLDREVMAILDAGRARAFETAIDGAPVQVGSSRPTEATSTRGRVDDLAKPGGEG